MIEPSRLPLRLIFIDAIGVILAALGLAGLFTNAGQLLPFLADRTIAGILTVLGFGLVTFAVGNLVRWKRMQSGGNR